MIDIARFNHYILGRPPLWAKQREICRGLAKHRTTLVPSGNATGKTFCAAGIVLAFLCEHPGSLVVTTAPTQTQLEQVLWKEIGRAHAGSFAALPGTILKNPLKLDLGDGWQALGYATTKTERLSGHHASDLLVVVDEASGVEPEIFEALDSLNPSRMLLIGNPLRPSGPFYERCMQARAGKAHDAILIEVPSLLSPDITLARSPRGLADATWLASALADYGESSSWWQSHVLARFPDSAEDTVIPRDWLDRAGSCPVPQRRGPARMAIDLGGGDGGDRSVLLVRDADSILHLEHSPDWPFEVVAAKAAELARRFNVAPSRIAFDASGIGLDFGNRLAAAGLHGCKAYRGGSAGNEKHANLRSAATWLLRQRLDPNRIDGDGPQRPFHIRPDWLAAMREELQALRYALDARGRVQLEPKADLARRIRRSPDLADTLIISFGFPAA